MVKRYRRQAVVDDSELQRRHVEMVAAGPLLQQNPSRGQQQHTGNTASRETAVAAAETAQLTLTVASVPRPAPVKGGERTEKGGERQ